MGDWRREVEDLLGRGRSELTFRDIESFASRLGSGRKAAGLTSPDPASPDPASPDPASPDLTGPELIDRIAALERLKAAASAEQARAQSAFADLCAAGDDVRAAAL
ncbi:MAG: hypothetical protein HOQ07_14040, partial [Sinomonas sp.]|nr:hypothetical protein [Sinomonas sp.]